jgi:alkylation response protein AidB-like acyl-CoA dehydrogenase
MVTTATVSRHLTGHLRNAHSAAAARAAGDLEILARELLGGNGILLDNHVGRFVADADAIYSYKGTREMNILIVGKVITGLSCFV